MTSNKQYHNLKIVSAVITLLLLITIGVTYYLKFYKEDLNRILPMTNTMKSDEENLENNRYQIYNKKLRVTYDNGYHWKVVPASLEELFAGDYNGSRQNLIDGSYVITRDRMAFVIGEQIVIDNEYRGTNFSILQSTDKGKTWIKKYVTDSPDVRVRFLGFTSEQNGYLIISSEGTMGFEANAIYNTNDGGNRWIMTGTVKDTNRHITSGSFINENIGFISFGSIAVNSEPEGPSVYRTFDGGKNWDEIEIPIPSEFKGIFTVAEVPTFDEIQGILHVNQGPNGDYQGGNVVARFNSIDEGATWSFVDLVEPVQ
ncbi:WD40/YVTN/BNR-like repeat-containing protein [Paenibacillus antarcticus]|uniref:Oxidoreductase n=1 Tax=Paenibacillus antarcticus TaxID=253703 RepID=A0A168Q3I5_9BACL|nr:sialidase family protein [Paenibacillus antarcticus]OAB47350.1 hypothetical protein PBAT_06520 [Paenibacillus antarcticus]